MEPNDFANSMEYTTRFNQIHQVVFDYIIIRNTIQFENYIKNKLTWILDSTM